MLGATKIVLDASALLSLLNNETGAERVLSVLDHAVMSTVNSAEVVARLMERGMQRVTAAHVVDVLGMELVPFSKEQALICGELRLLTKAQGLSLGDRACLALAQSLSAPVMTADRVWLELELELEITCIR